MMNDIYIKDFDSYENVIKKFEESLVKITEIFNNQNQNIEKINKTETWTGKAQESTYKKYKELENKYEEIEESLYTCIRFMKKTLEDYKNADKQFNSDLEDNSIELNVN